MANDVVAKRRKVEKLNLYDAFTHEPETLDFCLPGLLSGTIGALVAPGATGKTLWALQAAVTVAGGPDLLELGPVPTGRVVCLSAEDPDALLARRFHALGAYLSVAQRGTVVENLDIYPLLGCGADVMTPEWRDWIRDVTRRVRLVVLDTLRRFHQLDENDSGQMAKLLGYLESVCRDNATTFLYLHHLSKAGAANSGTEQQASRGSSVLTDNARLQMNMMVMSRKEAEEYGVDEKRRRYFVKLTYSKVNCCEPLPDCWYQRQEGGVLRPATLEKHPKLLAKRGNKDEAAY